MGGIGSGYSGLSRPTREAFGAVDVRQLHRAGLLEAGPDFEKMHLQLLLGTSGRVVKSARLERSGQKGDMLVYTFDWYGTGTGGPVTIEQKIPVVWTGCHYGGRRPWFHCPGRLSIAPCGRRVAMLYGDSQTAGMLCRHCCRFGYSSQREDTKTRAFRRGQRGRAKLGETWSNHNHSVPPRPKGMHGRTYRRLKCQIEGEEAFGKMLLRQCEARTYRVMNEHLRKQFQGDLLSIFGNDDPQAILRGMGIRPKRAWRRKAGAETSFERRRRKEREQMERSVMDVAFKDPKAMGLPASKGFPIKPSGLGQGSGSTTSAIGQGRPAAPPRSESSPATQDSRQSEPTTVQCPGNRSDTLSRPTSTLAPVSPPTLADLRAQLDVMAQRLAALPASPQMFESQPNVFYGG